MLSFNLTSIVNLIGFVLLVLFLYSKLYKPFFDITDKRKREVEKNLNEAEKLRIEAEENKTTTEKELEKIRTERNKIISNAEKDAKKIIFDAKSQAEEEKSRIISKAEKDSEEIKIKTAKEMESKVVNIAIKISSLILKESMTKELNDQLIKRANNVFKSKGDQL